MAPNRPNNLTATRLMLLYRLSRLDRDGMGLTKSELTEGLPPRTAANRWKMLDQLFLDGYVFRSHPQVGAPRYHIDVQGLHALRVAKALDGEQADRV